MTTTTDIVNRALQRAGTRTNVTSSELANQTSNEAIQAQLILTSVRDELLRKAPWDCCFNYANLTYITSVPGTPENTTSGSTTWAKGIPPPPWSYEYQYPVDCLKACWVVPQFVTGFSSGVPITTAVTGSAPTLWQGPPVKFKIAVDQFFSVTAAAVSAGGLGYVVGDQITLATTPASTAPIGAPAVLQVATVSGSAVATVSVVNQISGESPGQTGSYFSQQTNPVAQSSTTGSGTGATFTLTYAAKGDQRVILTNQEFALLAYVRQVIDPNVMDPLFIDAWTAVLGAKLAFQLTGDKAQANICIGLANEAIMEARKADGNEGLTVNDVTPDWLRVRGIDFPSAYAFGGPYSASYDWGALWASY